MDEMLTDEEIQDFRDTLVELRESLREDLDRDADSVRRVDLDEPIGRLSRIDAIQQQKMAQAGKRRIRARLEMIKAALARIDRDDGSYGICAMCHDVIPRKRLEARPESNLCIECQEETEGGGRRRRRRRK